MSFCDAMCHAPDVTMRSRQLQRHRFGTQMQPVVCMQKNKNRKIFHAKNARVYMLEAASARQSKSKNGKKQTQSKVVSIFFVEARRYILV